MAKAATKTNTKTKTGARAKTLSAKDGARLGVALTAEEGAYLRKLKSKAERGVALTPQQRSEMRSLDARRIARLEAARAWRNGRKAAAKKKAKAKATAPASVAKETVSRLGAAIETLEAEVAKVAATGATPAATQTLSKAELIGGIKVALTITTDEATRKGLEMALELARKLEG